MIISGKFGDFFKQIKFEKEKKQQQKRYIKTYDLYF